ncbi:MAG: methionyl-tRNA formyltransferase [Lachnospiraceae bacterium]|nr:methionyl-tRNA formyltransferase [Lachnospiraceae bacterium]
MKIVFMGTPDFAVYSLEALIGAGHDVVCVVTQPDRQKGRGKEFSFCPVKECAVKHGIDVFQPAKIKDPEAVSELSKYEADIFVVAAFGQILSEEILNMPRYGCINIHASLLPHLRGAAPIQWSILNGDKETGVSIQRMEKGLDTGDILIKEAIPIEDDETGNSLFDKLMILGGKLVVRVLPMIEDGSVTYEKQDETKATYASKITKEMGLINWSDDADRIERYVRGLNSWPSAYTYVDGKMLKIWGARVTEDDGSAAPGTVTSVKSSSFTVKTGSGSLEITELQIEGKKRMNAGDFLRGYKIEAGMKL